MILTVTTAKDTLAHLQRFVAGNLAGGVDHLIVCLDAPDAPDQVEAAAWLHAHPHVTCVACDDAWWAGDRPPQLNVRQRVNANVAKWVLGETPGVDWLFHIDADEIIQLDADVMATVPADVPAVQLVNWETVSQMRWEGEPHLFKTPLGDRDLLLLRELGVIERSLNSHYFHGHIGGKGGVRPSVAAWMTLHRPVDAHREHLPSFTHERLRVLHYESYSGEEFVRKWMAMMTSGPTASFRAVRGDTANALRSLVSKGLPPDKLEPYLMRIFERSTADDVETLQELGLLTELDPLAAGHLPAPWTGATAQVCARRYAQVRTEDKWRFRAARSDDEIETARARHEAARAGRTPGAGGVRPAGRVGGSRLVRALRRARPGAQGSA